MVWKLLEIFFKLFLTNICAKIMSQSSQNGHIGSQGTWGTAYRCQCPRKTNPIPHWSTTVNGKGRTVIATSHEPSHLSGKESAGGSLRLSPGAGGNERFGRTLNRSPPIVCCCLRPCTFGFTFMGNKYLQSFGYYKNMYYSLLVMRNSRTG